MNPTDIFDFKLVGGDDAPFLGYNSSSDKTRLKAGHMIRGSKNVQKKTSGNLASRCGLKRRGALDATLAPVDASAEWESNIGVLHPIRVQGGKLQVESDIVEEGTPVWYDLLETVTVVSPTGGFSRLVFDTWWDDVQASDKLLFVRGDDVMHSWSGGIAVIESFTTGLNPGTGTITKSGDESWAELGFAVSDSDEMKIMINGAEFAYDAGFGGRTLNIISGDTSVLTAGMAALQSVMKL